MTGEVSVIPYPWNIVMPKFSYASINSFLIGAAPENANLIFPSEVRLLFF